ncbi:PHD finger protein 14 isoform X2 [Planococcus citri]|uniref:PHD finger protein 14 isoform X2 n=1 Tax=Planococcus citri TaxID=170843 RepID=UPI0031F787F4
MERNSKRRQVKPSEALLDIDDLGESSDDSDFRIEDHCLESDSSGDSGSSDTSDDDTDSDDDESDTKEAKKPAVNNDLKNVPVKTVLENVEVNEDIIKNTLVCCVCLGDRSDDSNEIIECDGCGITVHEGCYGVQDNASLSSTVSSCSTEPWFCEACRAGVTNPTCELCPNFGGIFKETDVGKWVHLVCALYIPGIAFGDVDRLSSVTLFELPANRWGNKPCHLCQDHRFVRTGVTIECDAGMCRVYFHVTCGQREGLLSEATSEEADQADPFYAHCRLHSDKNQIKKRKRNWLALQLRTQKMATQKEQELVDETTSWKRNQRKLSKYQVKYVQLKTTRAPPWVPLQKRPRLLTTSASACRALWNKSELMGIDIASYEDTEALITTIQEIPKKWNIPPAFSVEFIGYFLDRDARVNRLKKQLSYHAENKSRLTNEQQELQKKYDAMVAENNKTVELNNSLRSTFQKFNDIILKVRPNAKLKHVDEFGKITSSSTSTPKIHHPLASAKGSVPTAAALKAGVGFPLRLPSNSAQREDKISLDLNNKCGICCKSTDQHLLAKCDTCAKYYHLGCLNPPLTRMPKKTKLMGWQCSECDKNSSSSDIEHVDTEAPRKLRRSSKERGDFKNDTSESSARNSFDAGEPVEIRKIKKHKREKHRLRYPDGIENIQIPVEKHHSRKRKHRSPDHSSENEPERPRQGIKLFIKSVPNSSGQANFVATQSSSTSTFVSKTEEYVKTPPNLKNIADIPIAVPTPKSKPSKSPSPENCDTCQTVGTNANMVRCDECSKSFHFTCLDPPVKKSPKVRGYSWHCANCDPTETDSD